MRGRATFVQTLIALCGDEIQLGADGASRVDERRDRALERPVAVPHDEHTRGSIASTGSSGITASLSSVSSTEKRGTTAYAMPFLTSAWIVELTSERTT